MTDHSTLNAQQPGRGRQAVTPTEIPPSGWKDILWRVYRAITQDRILLTAAGATFYILLALVPTLNAFVSIYGLFNDRANVVQHVDLLVGIVPAGALEIIRDQLTRLTSESSGTLSLTLIISLSLALWSASAGVKAMFDAMNIAYHEEEKRSFFVFNGLALLFTFSGAVAAVLVAAVVLVMPPMLSILPGGDGLQWVVRIASYTAMLVVVSLSVAALYRWGPSREQARWRWITPGALLSVITLGVGSMAFSWYVSNFTNDNATYGSIGAVIGLMTWLWISVTLVIVGAEVNSEIEHQTARDTTTGAEEPLGERGAHMADHVGRVWPLARDKVEVEAPQPKAAKHKMSLGAMAFALPVATALSVLQKRRPQP